MRCPLCGERLGPWSWPFSSPTTCRPCDRRRNQDGSFFAGGTSDDGVRILAQWQLDMIHAQWDWQDLRRDEGPHRAWLYSEWIHAGRLQARARRYRSVP